MPGNGSKRWQWSEHLWLPLLGAAARASWQWPIAHWVLHGALVEPGAALPLWLMVLLLFAPGLMAQALPDRRWRKAAIALAGALAILLAALIATRSALGGVLQQFAALGAGLDALERLPAAIPVLAFALTLWLQGSLADWRRYAQAWQNALLGASALALLAALSAARGQQAESPLNLAMVIFLVTSLLALALLSVRGTLALERIRHDRRLSVSRYWLGAMLALIALLLLAGWLIANATDPALVRAVAAGLTAAARWLGHLLAQGLAWVVYAIFRVLTPLIAWLQQQTFVSPSTAAIEQLGEQMRQLAEGRVGAEGAPQWWERLVTVLGGGATTIVAFWLLLRAVRGRRLALATGDEERESVFSMGLLQSQLRSLFGRQRVTRHAPYLAIAGDDPGAVIRRAYQRLLLAWQHQQGGRQPGETPHQLAVLLAARLPAAADEIARLTDAYAQARYGGAVDQATAQMATVSAERVIALLNAATP